MRRYVLDYSLLCGGLVLTAMLATSAKAQTIPMHSGHPAHGAPQMRVHGSGLHYPNRPKYHHHLGYAGYRGVYTGRGAPDKQAAEAAFAF